MIINTYRKKNSSFNLCYHRLTRSGPLFYAVSGAWTGRQCINERWRSVSVLEGAPAACNQQAFKVIGIQPHIPGCSLWLTLQDAIGLCVSMSMYLVMGIVLPNSLILQCTRMLRQCVCVCMCEARNIYFQEMFLFFFSSPFCIFWMKVNPTIVPCLEYFDIALESWCDRDFC